MSCFIVENKTLNKIATLVFQDNLFLETKENLASLGIKTPAELVDAMYKLNLAAYLYRYDDEKDPGEKYKYKKLGVSAVEVAKALACWGYQCSEGTIDQDPLYIIMQEFRAVICQNIVSNLPEYDTAPWG